MLGIDIILSIYVPFPYIKLCNLYDDSDLKGIIWYASSSLLTFVWETAMNV